MIGVRGNDETPPRDLGMNQLGLEALALRDETHLIGYVTPAGVMHLRDTARVCHTDFLRRCEPVQVQRV